MVLVTFELSLLEEKRYKDFAEKHFKCAKPSCEKLDSVSLVVIPTGLGNLVSCRCTECGEQEEITDINELF